MTRAKVALSVLHKRSLYAVLALLWTSGTAWLYLHYAVETNDAATFVQTWGLKIHGAAAMAYLVTLGTLLPIHVRMAWQQKRNRMAGAALMGLNLFLTLTGWMLYYVGSDIARPWISALHGGVGLGLPLFLYLHIRFSRRYP